MAGRNEVHSPLVGESKKPSQFDPFVATDAGIRRRAARITREKIINDRRAKQRTLIDDLIGNLQTLRHILGNADLAATALLPLFRGGDVVVFVFPDLERHAVDIVALTDQEGRRHGAIHTAAHSQQDRRLIHKPVLYWRESERARGELRRLMGR